MGKKSQYHSSLPQIGYNTGNKYKREDVRFMVGQVWKLTCAMCSLNETYGTKSEARYYRNKHQHIDTFLRRVA